MWKRKLYAGVLTTLITSTYFGVSLPLFEVDGPISNVFISLHYISVGVMYGILISILIENLTKKLGYARLFYSLIFHLGATLPLIIYPLLLIWAIPIAALFFSLDEFIRWFKRTDLSNIFS